MIAVEEKRRSRTSADFQQGAFAIREEDLGGIFGILRDQIYSDKPMAVVREYMCNAIDANIQAGRGNLPIEIHVPHANAPYFAVRDFGPGLTQEELFEIYVSYGRSTKRDSNDYVGCLGIGAKSAFCYSDSFTVTSILNGVKTIYSCYIDSSNVGKIAKMSETSTTEENGIEIKVPVKVHDFNVFAQKASFISAFCEVTPTVKGGYLVHTEVSGTPIVKKDNWALYSFQKNYVVMGNVPYEMDLSKVNNLDYNLKSYVRGLVVRAPIGSVEFAASRETLEYKETTQKYIAETLKKISSSFVQEVEDKLKNCKNLSEAYKYYKNEIGSNQFTARMLSSSGKDIKWKDLNLNSYHINIPEELKFKHMYAKVNKKTYSSDWTLELKELTMSSLDNKYFVYQEGLDFIPTRVLSWLLKESNVDSVDLLNKGTRTIPFFVYTDKKDLDDFLTLTGIDNIVDISTYDPYKKPKVPRTAPKAKNLSRVVKPKASYGHISVGADFWEDALEDLEDGTTYVYVPLDRFMPVTSFYSPRHSSGMFNTLSSLATFITYLNETVMKMQPATIIGVKTAAVDTIKANPNCIHIDTYVKDNLESIIKQCPEIVQIMQSNDIISKSRNLFNCVPAKTFKCSDGKMATLLARVEKVKDNANIKSVKLTDGTDIALQNITSILSMVDNTALANTDFAKIKDVDTVVASFEEAKQKVLSEYPLLKKYRDNDYYYRQSNDLTLLGSPDAVNKDFVEYVNLIDLYRKNL